MSNDDRLDELQDLKTRVSALERTMAAVIDVLKEEMDKSDAYGFFKRMNKLLSINAMKKRLDDASQ